MAYKTLNLTDANRSEVLDLRTLKFGNSIEFAIGENSNFDSGSVGIYRIIKDSSGDVLFTTPFVVSLSEQTPITITSTGAGLTLVNLAHEEELEFRLEGAGVLAIVDIVLLNLG